MGLLFALKGVGNRAFYRWRVRDCRALFPQSTGSWNTRMLVETVLSMLNGGCHLKKVAHRVAAYFQSRLAFTMAAFNLLAQWHGLPADEEGFVRLSIAEFSL